MRNLLVLALCLPATACVIGSNDGDDLGGSNNGSNNGSNDDGTIAGLITSDQTWSGTVRIGSRAGSPTKIQPGVTVTVMPGTTLHFVGGAGLTVAGTLKIQGASAGKVKIEPESGTSFGGITVAGAPEAGTLELTHGVWKHGTLRTYAGATVTITDTKLMRANGDLLVMDGGSVTMTYSQIGPDAGESDSTHCNIHTSGNANTINITRSNINGVPYGLMLYGGQNAIFRNNNWYANDIDVDTQPGVSADFSGSWFDGAAPASGNGATITANNLAAARLTDAGVRP